MQNMPESPAGGASGMFCTSEAGVDLASANHRDQPAAPATAINQRHPPPRRSAPPPPTATERIPAPAPDPPRRRPRAGTRSPQVRGPRHRHRANPARAATPAAAHPRPRHRPPPPTPRHPPRPPPPGQLQAMSTPVSVLSDVTILELVQNGRIRIDPWEPSLVQPASVDLRLGDSFRVF